MLTISCTYMGKDVKIKTFNTYLEAKEALAKYRILFNNDWNFYIN